MKNNEGFGFLILNILLLLLIGCIGSIFYTIGSAVLGEQAPQTIDKEEGNINVPITIDLEDEKFNETTERLKELNQEKQEIMEKIRQMRQQRECFRQTREQKDQDDAKSVEPDPKKPQKPSKQLNTDPKKPSDPAKQKSQGDAKPLDLAPQKSKVAEKQPDLGNIPVEDPQKLEDDTYRGEVPMTEFYINKEILAYRQVPGASTDPLEQIKKVPLERLHPGDILKAKLDYGIYLYSHNHKTINPEIYLKGGGISIKGFPVDIVNLVLGKEVLPDNLYFHFSPPNAMGIGFVDYIDDKLRASSMDPQTGEPKTYHQKMDDWMIEIQDTLKDRRHHSKNKTPLCKGYFDYIEKRWKKVEISDAYVDWINTKFNPDITQPYPKMKELIHQWILSHVQYFPCGENLEKRITKIRKGQFGRDNIVYIGDEYKKINQGKAPFRLYGRVSDFIDPLEIPVVLKVKS